MAKQRGYIVLQGGAEFGGKMAVSDLRAIELAGGKKAPVCIIPTAAAPDNNHERAGDNGRKWFMSLGARNVSVVGIIDRPSANTPEMSDQIGKARLIYMLGGFPAYLSDTLRGSACWKAVLAAYSAGAVLAGSSAGAMVLCEYLFDPARKAVTHGLGLLSDSCVLPHHNTFGRDWAPRLQKDLPRATLIGIDERTGMINDGPNGCWNIYGQHGVTIYRNQGMERHRAEACFKI